MVVIGVVILTLFYGKGRGKFEQVHLDYDLFSCAIQRDTHPFKLIERFIAVTNLL